MLSEAIGWNMKFRRFGLRRKREPRLYFLCFFFFFQAEDGIRDADVTGVQTCALPISGDAQGVRCQPGLLPLWKSAPGCSPGRSASDDDPDERARPQRLRAGRSRHPRSEERRVGKEWRSRWGAEREKRKIDSE